MGKLAVGRKKRGGKRKHHLVKAVDPDKMIDAAVKRATCQPGVSRTDELSRSADQFLVERTGMLQEEFFSRVGAKLEQIVDLLTQDLIEKHDQIPPQNLPYALAVALDKANLLAGRPQALTAQLNVGLGSTGRSREDVVKALSREESSDE